MRNIFLALMIIFSGNGLLLAQTADPSPAEEHDRAALAWLKGPLREAILTDSLLQAGSAVGIVATGAVLPQLIGPSTTRDLGNWAVGLYLGYFSGQGIFDGWKFFSDGVFDAWDRHQVWQDIQLRKTALENLGQQASTAALTRRVIFGLALFMVGSATLLSDARAQTSFLSTTDRVYFSLMLGSSLVIFFWPTQTEQAWAQYQKTWQ